MGPYNFKDLNVATLFKIFDESAYTATVTSENEIIIKSEVAKALLTTTKNLDTLRFQTYRTFTAETLDNFDSEELHSLALHLCNTFNDTYRVGRAVVFDRGEKSDTPFMISIDLVHVYYDNDLIRSSSIIESFELVAQLATSGLAMIDKSKLLYSDSDERTID